VEYVTMHVIYLYVLFYLNYILKLRLQVAFTVL